jgi:hypothetical protein
MSEARSTVQTARVNGAADNNDDREPTAAFGEAIDIERVSANETG